MAFMDFIHATQCYKSADSLPDARTTLRNEMSENNHEKSDTSAVPLDCIVIRKNMDRFKIDMPNFDGWVVPPCVETKLKELCKKHNDLVDCLALDV